MDFTFITNFFADGFAFIDFIVSFIKEGIYDFYTEIFAQAIEWLTIWSIKSTIFALQFAFDIGQSILSNLNISTVLASAYSSLDANTTFYLSVLRFPEILNNLLSGLATGFAFRFIPTF